MKQTACMWQTKDEMNSGITTGGMGGSGPPTFVQTPPEINANQLKSFFIYGGYPMYVYCNFYCSPAKKNGSDPHFFWAGDATRDEVWKCEMKNVDDMRKI